MESLPTKWNASRGRVYLQRMVFVLKAQLRVLLFLWIQSGSWNVIPYYLKDLKRRRCDCLYLLYIWNKMVKTCRLIVSIFRGSLTCFSSVLVCFQFFPVSWNMSETCWNPLLVPSTATLPDVSMTAIGARSFPRRSPSLQRPGRPQSQ